MKVVRPAELHLRSDVTPLRFLISRPGFCLIMKHGPNGNSLRSGDEIIKRAAAIIPEEKMSSTETQKSLVLF